MVSIYTPRARSARQHSQQQLSILLCTLLALPSVLGSVLPSTAEISSGEIVNADLSAAHTTTTNTDQPLSLSLSPNIFTTTTTTANANDDTSNLTLHPRSTTTNTTSISTDTTDTSSSTFPTAFDTSLTNNFTTTTCATFFHNLLSNTTLTSCHAISLLLRDSTSFFHALTSAPTTSSILDTACASNLTTCSTALTSLASQLLQSSTCLHDYNAGNQAVVSAYTDLITYAPIYRATCLQSPETNNYCFVDAVTNTSNSVDYDVYFVPYGSAIDAAPWPTCNECLQATLNVYKEYASVDGQPLAGSYLPTARGVNGVCGSGFADVNVTVGVVKDGVSSGGAGGRFGGGSWGVMVVVVVGWSVGWVIGVV
ncbi:hypothetical protein AnigIFM63604_010288 [Aspergillus niger]|uniref:DUF7729 domain-containing protein n=1 Tax=Aspergillus niger TaxID=5061 RepID=A0A3F3R9E3_ASPNG|nr:hypothetical protein CBS147321_7842 [Aspergillus niger]KAI3028040.1 hypothetical protein CBS147482_554 [Aspergillus niger]KAI3036055.1 hypothetical protein CBS147345_269 [Aspergillus niger]GLA53198.1 hypothetical protein AnigIFM63604_010288 [Aspergillus niger]SPB44282.1 unnamed protein product [Aspergillus niger]